jgi:hypothetical protein
MGEISRYLEELARFAEAVEHDPIEEPCAAEREPAPKILTLTWAEWKARQLNLIFAKHGHGGPGRITAATVEHGGK